MKTRTAGPRSRPRPQNRRRPQARYWDRLVYLDGTPTPLRAAALAVAARGGPEAAALFCAHAVDFAFDPGQLRGPDGRWTHVESASESEKGLLGRLGDALAGVERWLWQDKAPRTRDANNLPRLRLEGHLAEQSKPDQERNLMTARVRRNHILDGAVEELKHLGSSEMMKPDGAHRELLEAMQGAVKKLMANDDAKFWLDQMYRGAARDPRKVILDQVKEDNFRVWKSWVANGHTEHPEIAGADRRGTRGALSLRQINNPEPNGPFLRAHGHTIAGIRKAAERSPEENSRRALGGSAVTSWGHFHAGQVLRASDAAEARGVARAAGVAVPDTATRDDAANAVYTRLTGRPVPPGGSFRTVEADHALAANAAALGSGVKNALRQAATPAQPTPAQPTPAKVPAGKKSGGRPRKETGDHAATVAAAVALYQTADTAAAKDIEALGERLRALPKAALLRVAAGLGYTGGARQSAAKLADALHKRIADRRGAALRVGLIHRGAAEQAARAPAAKKKRARKTT